MSFARLVSLACHDLRTPLATVNGFARTMTRLEDLSETAERYLEMMALASEQMADLLDELSVAARIEAGHYEPLLRAVDSLAVAEAAAGPLDRKVAVEGRGVAVEVEPDDAERALRGLARCALRHGGLERVELRVAGAELTVSPVVPEAAQVVLGEDLRDLGAAVGRKAVEAMGGSVELDGETLVVRLPQAEGDMPGP